jgi:uncharacterized protein (TIGR00369 family)
VLGLPALGRYGPSEGLTTSGACAYSTVTRFMERAAAVLQDDVVTTSRPAASGPATASPSDSGKRVLDPATETRIREGIGRQTLLSTLGVTIAEVGVGRVSLDLPYRADLCQQNGYVHAGAITTLADSACGYAAASLMPHDRDVLTVEFKVNLLAPARGDRFRATGEVVRAGRTLTICSAEVVAWADNGDGNPSESLVRVALMQATMMAVTPPR